MTSRDSDTVIKNLPDSLHSHKNTSIQWKQVKLGKLLEDSFQNGIYKPSSAYGSGVPIIRINNFDNEGNFVSLEFQRLTIKKSEIESFKVQENDILINRVNSLSHIGKSIIVKNISEPTVYESNMMRLRITNNELLPDFLAYILQTSQARNHFKTVAKKAVAQASINQTDVKSLEILLPPLPEQRRIAEILSTCDEAITLTERLIAARQRRKRALMQQLLTGRRRFREFEGEEWREVKLGNVAKLTAGGTPSTLIPEYWGGNIPWMKSGEVNLKRVYDVTERITQAGLKNSSTKLIPANSVLIALAGQGKTRGTVAINKIELCTNQSIAAIMPNSDTLYYEYLFYNLDSRYDELRRLSSGEGGRGGLNLQILENVKLVIPLIDEQHKIAAVLQACDEEIALLGQKLAALKRQKQGLMQKLLTGQVRVKVKEDNADAME